jgi:hypothetical protein
METLLRNITPNARMKHRLLVPYMVNRLFIWNSVERNNTMSSMFRTQYTPEFFVAEYYGLRNTSSWGSKDHAYV